MARAGAVAREKGKRAWRYFGRPVTRLMLGYLGMQTDSRT
jgi:hypothetical protein